MEIYNLDLERVKINGAAAFMEGKYQAEGDMRLLLKLDQLFAKASQK